MNESLRQQFDRLSLRLAELDANLADPQVASDMKRYRVLAREQAEAADVVGRWRRYQQRESDLAAAREMRDHDSDPEMAEMVNLLPSGPGDVRRDPYRDFGEIVAEIVGSDAGIPRPVPYAMMARATAGGVETPINVGEQTLSVSVSTRWTFSSVVK